MILSHFQLTLIEALNDAMRAALSLRQFRVSVDYKRKQIPEEETLF